MSWSISVGPLEDAALVRAIEGLELPPGNSTAPVEAEAQLAAAKNAAMMLLVSGALGRQGRFIVSLSGHANPGHVRPSGWSQDDITVRVSQEWTPDKRVE